MRKLQPINLPMDQAYISTSVARVLTLLQTSTRGLSTIEARRRLELYGFNNIEPQKISLFRVFVQQYANFLMALLCAGAIFSFLLGQTTDALVIMTVLLINGLLGTFQEYRAETLMRALKNHIPDTVYVRREGKEMIITRKELVQGDIVVVQSGHLAPADMRVIGSYDLRVDESALTGESVSVLKNSDALAGNISRTSDMKNVVFSGTMITEGEGECVVLQTGAQSEFGHIVSLVHHAQKHSSFLAQINGLSSFLFWITVVSMGGLFVFLIIFKSAWGLSSIFLFAVALTISIVPSMLPLISTIALTSASMALAKKGVVIKRLTSLEDLGAVDVICADKTGTLTENSMRVADVVATSPQVCSYYALLASDETSMLHNGQPSSFDGAIVAYVSEMVHQQKSNHHMIWNGVFDPAYKWQFKVYAYQQKAELVIKGAPESILSRCQMSPHAQQEILEQAERYGEQGFRALAIARAYVPLYKEYTHDQIHDMDFVGLMIFEDPIKATAAHALARARQLGVSVKILTGDAPAIALHVAREVGMHCDENQVVIFSDIAHCSEKKKREYVERAVIFARMNPEEKYEIIRLLSEQHSVMFLGEGINDAPALKCADVGMCVKEASDIAQEASDILLTKSDLSVIIDAIEYGRKIMLNIYKYILVTLTGNFGSLYAVSFLSLFAPVLPLLPTQLLLENILTDMPMVSSVTSRIHRTEGMRPVRQSIRTIAFHGLLFSSVVLIVQVIFYFMFSYLPVELFRTLWLIEIILFEFMLVVALFTRDWLWHTPVVRGKTGWFFAAITLCTLALPYIPVVNSWFHIQPYEIVYLIPLMGLMCLGLLMIELLKWVLRKKERIIGSYSSNN